MDKAEIYTNIGVIIAGLIGILAGYFSKRKPPTGGAQLGAVVAGVGLELGNRLQADELTYQVKRCADSLAILADRKQAGIEEKLNELLERVDDRR